MKKIQNIGPELGAGIYTIPDIALVLSIPYRKALKWINKFWNEKLGAEYNLLYTWEVDLTKAVNFHTLVELFTFYQLSTAGVSTHELLKVHSILSKQFNTCFPFANKLIVEALRTDGRKIDFEQKDGSIYSVDAAHQFKLDFVKDFYKNLDFDSDSLAIRLWPLGKEHHVVCDPEHQFGQPVIEGTNIQTEVLYNLYLAKEPINFIAKVYEILPSQVESAIEFHKNAA